MTNKKAIGVKESKGERYAVIEAGRKGLSSERVVITYHDEQSLRELIAKPTSITEVGFDSVEAAVATFPKPLSRDVSLVSIPLGLPLRGDKYSEHRDKLQSSEHEPRTGFGLPETRRLLGGLFQHAIAVIALTFYSRTLLGAVIRAALGA